VDLTGKQSGAIEIATIGEPHFFTQWLPTDYPWQDGTPLAAIKKILIADTD
jgi:hypothetical protein